MKAVFIFVTGSVTLFDMILDEDQDDKGSS
jgi:hypothetical protein